MQVFQRRHQSVGHVDRVLPLRFQHIERQRALAVVQRQRLLFFLAIDHRRDLRQQHRLIAAPGDDDAAEILRILDAALDLHEFLIRQRADRAARQFLILVAHRVDHLIDTDAERFHLVGFYIDLDLALDAANQGHGTDAAHVFQAFLDDLIGNRGQFAQIALFGAGFVSDGDREDRLVGRIVARHARLLDFLAECRFDQRDFFTHVLRGLRRIDGQHELNDHHRRAFVGA